MSNPHSIRGEVVANAARLAVLETLRRPAATHEQAADAARAAVLEALDAYDADTAPA